MAKLLPFVEVQHGKGPADALVIWLHGLGDSGHGFAPIVPELKLDPSLSVRFVFPHAPVRPITINGGAAMPGWYDIAQMDLANRADEKGVRESAKAIEALIDSELAKGIKPERMVLAGFSQGGVMAYHIGTRLPLKIAGIMALSTYLCAPGKLADEVTEANKDTAIFAAHGTHDDVVPFMAGKMAADKLTSLGYKVAWHDYPMQHNVCPQELNDIRTWLQQVLA